MAKRKVFYSFHFDNDVMRVQLVRNIGVLEGNEPVSKNDWEQLKKNGDLAVERWIDKEMSDKHCVIVLIGEKTSEREWVQYEIKKAWNSGKALLGIYIHNLQCANRARMTGSGTCQKGANPFSEFHLNGISLSSIVKTYDPSYYNPYGEISSNIDRWIEEAIQNRQSYR